MSQAMKPQLEQLDVLSQQARKAYLNQATNMCLSATTEAVNVLLGIVEAQQKQIEALHEQLMPTEL